MPPRPVFPFRVGKIVAIGRNYADHAKELGNAIPSEPFFFIKPSSSVVWPGQAIEVPEGIEVHHEVELAVVVGAPGRDIPEASAMDYVGGYCLALDLTARGLQDEAKAQRRPWSAAKGFDSFTPLSGALPAALVGDPHDLSIWCDVDGKRKQDGSTSDMVFRIPRLLSHVSACMRLDPGDLILTGTPAGVGPVRPGQTVTAGIGPRGPYRGFFDVSFPAVAVKRGEQ